MSSYLPKLGRLSVISNKIHPVTDTACYTFWVIRNMLYIQPKYKPWFLKSWFPLPTFWSFSRCLTAIHTSFCYFHIIIQRIRFKWFDVGHDGMDCELSFWNRNGLSFDHYILTTTRILNSLLSQILYCTVLVMFRTVI